MLVTLSGMVTEVREVQSRKAPHPMLVTPFGIVTEVRELHLLKASSPILVTLLGMIDDRGERSTFLKGVASYACHAVGNDQFTTDIISAPCQHAVSYSQSVYYHEWYPPGQDVFAAFRMLDFVSLPHALMAVISITNWCITF